MSGVRPDSGPASAATGFRATGFCRRRNGGPTAAVSPGAKRSPVGNSGCALSEQYPSVVEFSPGLAAAFPQPPPYVPIQPVAGPGGICPNHNQQRLPRKLGFPRRRRREIGPLMSGFSTLRRDQKPVSRRPLDLRIQFHHCGTFRGYFFRAGGAANSGSNFLGLCLLTTLLSWFLTGFKHRCTYVWLCRAARFTCSGGRHNVAQLHFYICRGRGTAHCADAAILQRGIHRHRVHRRGQGARAAGQLAQYREVNRRALSAPPRRAPHTTRGAGALCARASRPSRRVSRR